MRLRSFDKVVEGRKEKMCRAKEFLKIFLLTGSIIKAGCGGSDIATMPQETDKYKYCPDPRVIDFQNTHNSYMLKQEEVMILDNGVHVRLVDLAIIDNKSMAIIHLWYSGNDHIEIRKMEEGSLITVKNPIGVEQILECCSVNPGYTLNEKSAVFASDKPLRSDNNSK